VTNIYQFVIYIAWKYLADDSAGEGSEGPAALGGSAFGDGLGVLGGSLGASGGGLGVRGGGPAAPSGPGVSGGLALPGPGGVR